jgi:hypothetical protein
MSSASSQDQQFRSTIVRRWRWAGTAIGLIVVVFVALFLIARLSSQAVPIENLRPIEVLTDGYVSSKSCKKCHEREFTSWYGSYHRSMTQKISPETAPEFLSDTTVTLEGQVYRFEKRGDAFWIEMDDPATDSQKENPKRIRRQIVLSTGSHHMQVFWYATEIGRTLGAVPLTYLIKEEQWIPRKSAFLRPPDWPTAHELGRWNSTCLKCHSTHPRARLRGKSRWDTHVAEFGIACEACHGPGSNHVQAMSIKLEQKAASVKLGIVNPKKLDSHRSSETCGQCHSIRRSKNGLPSMTKYMEHGPRYRPGQKYEEASHFNFARCSPGFEDPTKGENPDMFWSDGMVRVSGREYNGLVESPCFQSGKLSCLSCHTMHNAEASASAKDWADDQLQAGMRGNKACLQCHSKLTNNIAAHTHHAINSSGSNCMNCHMPHTTYGLLKAIRSHQIDRPNATTGLKTGRMVACNQCHLDQSLGWTANYLEKWYGQKKPVLSEEQRTISVAVLHSLKGDAGQRALAAWSLGWKQARNVSGTDWSVPFLLTLMNDKYDAVRWIARRSLRSLPTYKNFEFDPFSKPGKRKKVTNEAIDIWDQKKHGPYRPRLLLGPNGHLQREKFRQLLLRRDKRPVNLAE